MTHPTNSLGKSITSHRGVELLLYKLSSSAPGYVALGRGDQRKTNHNGPCFMAPTEKGGEIIVVLVVFLKRD